MVPTAEALALIEGDPVAIRDFMLDVMTHEYVSGCTCAGLSLAITRREHQGLYTVLVYHSHQCPRLTHD